MPHKQGRRQLPLVASKSSNRARACSTGRVGKAVGVGDADGVLLGCGVNVEVGVVLWVGLGMGVGVLAGACPQAVSSMKKVIKNMYGFIGFLCSFGILIFICF